MSKLEIRRLGHAFYRIQTPGGRVLLIDPWVSGNPSLAAGWDDTTRYADVDHVLVTHGHFDHTTGVVEVMNAAENAQLIAQFEVVMAFVGEGVENVLPTNLGSTIDLDGIKVSAVTATHSSSIQDPDTGRWEYRGTPMGYVIEVEDGRKIYVAGDTGLTADMKFLVADFFAPEIAILPCDGLLTMSPEQAVRAAQVLGVTHVIPSHDFPNPDAAPGMAGMLEGFPFVGLMIDKRARFAELLGATCPDVAAVVLDHGDAAEF